VGGASSHALSIATDLAIVSAIIFIHPLVIVIARRTGTSFLVLFSLNPVPGTLVISSPGIAPAVLAGLPHCIGKTRSIGASFI